MNEPLEPPRAEPDFEAQDELSDWAVEHAEMLAGLDRAVLAVKAVAA